MNKNIFKKFISFIMVFTIIFSTQMMVPSASAIRKIKGEPFKILTLKETMGKKKYGKNTIYIERIDSTIKTKNGYAYAKDDPDYILYYGDLRYKKKKLPVKTKMKTYIISNPLERDGEILDIFVARFDYAKVKVKIKIKKGKNKGKYKTVKRWRLLNCNGFRVN